MTYLVWTDDLDTGIDVIDGQHRRIVDYINKLRDAHERGDRALLGAAIEETVDYTLSHFGFEEALMEDAGYEFLRPHKRVHELFTKRVAEYQLRFKAGEDVSEEMLSLLSRWLFSHIRSDDASFAKTHHTKVEVLTQNQKAEGWLAKTVGRFFRHRG